MSGDPARDVTPASKLWTPGAFDGGLGIYVPEHVAQNEHARRQGRTMRPAAGQHGQATPDAAKSGYGLDTVPNRRERRALHRQAVKQAKIEAQRQEGAARVWSCAQRVDELVCAAGPFTKNELRRHWRDTHGKDVQIPGTKPASRKGRKGR